MTQCWCIESRFTDDRLTAGQDRGLPVQFDIESPHQLLFRRSKSRARCCKVQMVDGTSQKPE